MYVVAGASGRTGRVVAETLLARGSPVRVLLRDPEKGEAWRARGAEVAVVSLDDAAALERALRGASGFYTLLPEDIRAPDFHGHRRAVSAATAAAVSASRVPHVVLLSGTAASLTEGSGLGLGLHEIERQLAATGTRLSAIRAASFQENVLFALTPAMRDGIYPNFMASADIAFPTVATRDVGRFAATCLLEPPARSEAIDLVGPAYTVRQMAVLLGAALGKQLQLVDVPAVAHVAVLTQAGLPSALAESVAEFYACVAAGRVQPRGDRIVEASTRLDEILPALVGAA